MLDILSVIPARGGSQRLRRKNTLPVGGVPMFLRTARSAPGRVVVSTDDDEIASMCRLHRFETHIRSNVSATETVPEVASMVAGDLHWTGPVLAIQPTVQPFPPIIWDQDQPTVFSLPTNHLYWHEGHRIESPSSEVGVYYWPAGRVGEAPTAHIDAQNLLVDIDTPDDYLTANHLSSSHSIYIRAAASTTWNGTGHYRRMETLGLYLQHHDLYWTGDDFFSRVDLAILDQGNTTPQDILEVREFADQVITFEDLGLGRAHTDLTFNALLPPSSLSNVLSGPDYAILRPEFYALPAYNPNIKAMQVLIMFGGTDAKNLTPWIASLVEDLDYEPIYHTGPGVAEAMHNADILICGAGQLVHEAARVGIPTITLAATQREASHGHLGHPYGNLYLGLATTVTDDQIRQAVHAVMTDKHLRVELSQRSQATVDGKGLDRILWRIDGLLNDL